MDADAITQRERYARIAGILYLLLIACGIFAEAAARSGLLVPGSPAATAERIAGVGMLYGAGFVADAVMLLCDVAIAVLFYLIFRPVSRPLALAATAFRLTQAAVLGVNLLFYTGAVLALSIGIETASAHDIALLFLSLHGYGYDLGLIFFGVSNLLLGILIVRSGFLPVWLGYAVGAAAGVYLLGSFTRFTAPEFNAALQPLYLIPLLAETALALRLAFRGTAQPG